jgi:undecaprenyl diphosphate synthase
MGFFLRRKEESKDRVVCDDRLKHIAFIMDGNGRWAKARNLPRSAGHQAGAKTFRRMVDYMKVIQLRYMTVYAFSTENWSRPKEEVDAIMKLLDSYIEDALTDVAENDVRVIFIGDKTPLSASLQAKMNHLEEISQNNHLILNVAINYGSRAELVHAVQEAIDEGDLPISEEVIERHLYTKASPPPDLIIRTAGELRLSNFLLWQAAYSEFYFTPALWPDLTEKEVDEAIRTFYKRKRRFGGVDKK